MRVYCSVVDDVLSQEDKNFSNADLIIFGFNSLKRINYKNELAGSEDSLLKISKLSKRVKKTIIVGAYTNNYSVIRKSALVADCGKILGIYDMHYKRQETCVSVGCGCKIYQTSIGKIGILIDDDIFNYDAVKSLAVCDTDLIVFLTDKKDKLELDFLFRAYSFLFGIPIIVLCPNGIILTDQNGQITTYESKNKVDLILNTRKNYSILTTKQRGLNKQ